MKKQCEVNGCENEQKTKGYCSKHYLRFRRSGSTSLISERVGKTRMYLEQVILPYNGSDCLIWPYSRTPQGYGQMSYKNEIIMVHRLICIVKNGIPCLEKNDAAHSCGNGRLGCVSPGHISWKSRKENMDDKYIHGTNLFGVYLKNSKLNDNAVKDMRIKYESGLFTQRKIASFYNVSLSTAQKAINRVTWRHI